MGRLSLNTMVLLGAMAGLVSGLGAPQPVLDTAAVVSDLFIRLLRLVSAPIIFFALLSTLTGMKNTTHARNAGGYGFEIFPVDDIIGRRDCTGCISGH